MNNRTFFAGKFAAQEARKADEARADASGHTAWKRREAAQAAAIAKLDADVAVLGAKAIAQINAGETRTGNDASGVVPVHSSPAPNAAAVRLGTNRGCDRTVAAPKYMNVKTGGYSSKNEANRALALRLRQEAGQIRNLREQVSYVLIPRQLNADGGVAERACKYVADFVYEEFPDWIEIVEDTKGFRTADYIIKRKLMRFTHGIVIKET